MSQRARATPVQEETLPQGRGKALIDFHDSDLLIGLVAPIGADLERIAEDLSALLKRAGYDSVHIRVSKDIIGKARSLDRDGMEEAQAIRAFRDAGDQMRRDSHDNAVLADGVAHEIRSRRQAERSGRCAYIINSLKHPEEVRRLRRIYAGGFYLIAVAPDDAIVKAFLKQKGVADDDALKLIPGDHDDVTAHDREVSNAFHMADFFVRMNGQEDRLQGELERICRILFGDPFATPTFDEYAMFLAFASSLRSADTSRQVGAVLAREQDILSTGANDCPKFGGGLYWSEWIPSLKRVGDQELTRDYMAGGDPNRGHINAMIDEIARSGEEHGLDRTVLKQVLEGSPLRDITEYQRAVHAEMEALLSAARSGVSTRDAILYCTTFPCHNCAKHIVAAGIKRVLYVEPYRKSKAQDLHKDAVHVGPSDPGAPPDKVGFEPFVGVGPRRFFDFFSVRLGSGLEIDRKAHTKSWTLANTLTLRVQMRPGSFLDMEREADARFESHLKAES